MFIGNEIIPAAFETTLEEGGDVTGDRKIILKTSEGSER